MAAHRTRGPATARRVDTPYVRDPGQLTGVYRGISGRPRVVNPGSSAPFAALFRVVVFVVPFVLEGEQEFLRAFIPARGVVLV
jgi:hypothetical protein